MIGATKTHYLFGLRVLKFETANHRPFRWYFRIRNTLITIRKYFLNETVWCFKEITHLLILVLLMLFFESERKKKLKLIFLGLYDAMRIKTDRKIIITR